MSRDLILAGCTIYLGIYAFGLLLIALSSAFWTV